MNIFKILPLIDDDNLNKLSEYRTVENQESTY